MDASATATTRPKKPVKTLSGRRKIALIAIGMVIWFVLDAAWGAFVLFVAGDGNTGPGSGFVTLYAILCLPVFLLLSFVLWLGLMIRRELRWAGVGVLAAMALNLLASVLLPPLGITHIFLFYPFFMPVDDHLRMFFTILG